MPKPNSAAVTLTALVAAMGLAYGYQRWSANANGRVIETQPVVATEAMRNESTRLRSTSKHERGQTDQSAAREPRGTAGGGAAVAPTKPRATESTSAGTVGVNSRRGDREAGDVNLAATSTTSAIATIDDVTRLTASVYGDEENLCQKYWAGPCYRDAHFLLPCSDPRISEWRLTPPGVRYLWCRDGSREVRLDGIAAPKAEASALRFASSVVAAKISFAATSEWGWYRAAPGDRYCPRVPKRGWCDESQPAVEGAYYLAYAGRLTHVTLLPCGDERVLAAIGKQLPNVYCAEGDEVVRFNANDAAMTPLRIYSEHDRINEGRR